MFISDILEKIVVFCLAYQFIIEIIKQIIIIITWIDL